MAIKYTDVHAEKSIDKLSDDEKKFLSKLEAYTDEVIKKKYGVDSTEHLYLDEAKVESCVKGLAIIRKAVVQKAWVELYKEAGWKLSFTLMRQENCWTLSPIKKQV